MDGVHMPFEGVLDYAAFSIRVPEADVEQLDALLRAVPAARKVSEYVRECVRKRAPRPTASTPHGSFPPSLPPLPPYFTSFPSLRTPPPARQAAMRAAMATLWTRFTYAKSILQPDAWLPRPELPRDYLKVPPLPLTTTCFTLHFSLLTSHYSLLTTHYLLTADSLPRGAAAARTRRPRRGWRRPRPVARVASAPSAAARHGDGPRGQASSGSGVAAYLR